VPFQGKKRGTGYSLLIIMAPEYHERAANTKAAGNECRYNASRADALKAGKRKSGGIAGAS
jgi:hypothetical protein